MITKLFVKVNRVQEIRNETVKLRFSIIGLVVDPLLVVFGFSPPFYLPLIHDKSPNDNHLMIIIQIVNLPNFKRPISHSR